MGKECKSCAANAAKAKYDIPDGVRLAMRSVDDLVRRKKMKLVDIARAVVVIRNHAVEESIMRLRSEGASIRAIARKMHMDDKRVSAIIKANIGKSEKPGKSKKSCSPCKCNRCGK